MIAYVRFGLKKRRVVEIKIESKVPRYVAVFNQAAQRLHHDGSDFYVITERNVQYAVQNGHIGQVLRYAKSELPQDELTRILSVVEERGPIRCEEVLTRAGVSMEHVLHLVARRALVAPRSGLIGAESLLQLPGEEDPVKAFERMFNVTPWQIQPEVAPPVKPARARVKKKPAPKGYYLRDAVSRGAYSEGLSLIAPGVANRDAPTPYPIRAARKLAERARDSQ